MAFAFVSGWKKSKEEKYFLTHENNMQFKFQCPQIKFYWDTIMPIHFHTYGLWWLSCYNGQVELQQRPSGSQNNKYLVFGPLQESLPVSALKSWEEPVATWNTVEFHPKLSEAIYVKEQSLCEKRSWLGPIVPRRLWSHRWSCDSPRQF